MALRNEDFHPERLTDVQRAWNWVAERQHRDREAWEVANPPEVDAKMIPEVMLELLPSTAQGRWFLEHGEVVEVSECRRGRWGLGACHSNARWLARRWPAHYRWWVGYALMPELWHGDIKPDNHSWVQRADGSHLEVTYDRPSRFYLGAPMSTEIPAHDCTGHPNECLAWFKNGGHP